MPAAPADHCYRPSRGSCWLGRRATFTFDWRWFGPMLMHADNRGVDHLDSASCAQCSTRAQVGLYNVLSTGWVTNSAALSRIPRSAALRTSRSMCHGQQRPLACPSQMRVFPVPLRRHEPLPKH